MSPDSGPIAGADVLPGAAVPGRAAASPSGSLQARLVLLAAAAIVPMLALFIAAAFSDTRAERSRAGQRQLEVARGMAGAVERELRGATASLQAIALSPELQQGDLERFRDLALRFVATQPAGSVLIVMDRSGQHLVNTKIPLGRPLPRRLPDITAATVADVFRTGQPLISNLVPRKAGSGPVVTAEVPVFRGDAVIYDLSLVLPAERFATIIAAQHLPPGVVSSIFDRAGYVVARLPDPMGFVGHLAPAALLPTLLSQPEGIMNVISLEGVPMLAVFSRSQPSGWSVCIGTPEDILSAPLRRTLLITLFAGSVGLLCSAVVGALLAQRVLGPMRLLACYAADPGGQPMAGGFGLREVEEVAAALRDSTRQRQAAMTALQALNDGLEERVRQETATRVQAQEKLAQAQRMEALGQLAGGIAHDFNNVLQAVIGGLSLVTRRAEDPDQVRRFAAMAGSAADRGAAITGRLLTFARRGELKAAPIAVAPLLCGLQEMLAPTLGPGIAIRVQADPNLPPLFADQAQLETVLVNLAVNARDAMPDGGTLTLSARCETVAGGGPDGGTADAGPLPGDYLRLDMTDTGTGMDAATLARAAEPFFTTKGPGHGTGLGLAMARGFAAQSGGGFAIASAPGRGTCVTLWLPQMRPKDGAGPAEPGQRRLAVAHGINILLVDDDAMVRDILAGELEARGLCVTTAGDAVQALGLLDQGLLFDVMVTDYAMPGMNGVALIREVRRRIPAQPVLLLTGFAEAGAAAALSVSRDEMTRLLRKPISGDDLAAAAAGLHARARHFA